MRTALLVLVLLAAPALAAQTVWKWVDAKGVVHYSDRPMPGAERIELNVGTSGSRAAPPPPSPSPPTSTQSREASGPAYQTLEIWKPANDEAIINTGGRVDVSIRIEPEVRDGHSLYLYMDGRLVEGFAPNTEDFQLTEVPRGTHTLIGVVLDGRGNRVAQTSPVTFHVRQTSVLNPNNPNAGNRAR